MKVNFSFKQITMTLLILILMISKAKLHDEIEELETNFLSHKDKDVNKSDKKESNKSNIILELNKVEELKKFFAENKKFLFEVYSSSCPHCVKLAPELDKIALEYKDRVKFLKTDGRDSYAYRSIVKIDHFPTLFIYDNGNLIELGGSLSYDSVKKYIEEKYFFKCEKIENINLLKSLIIALSNQRFFLGIIDKKNFETSYNLFYKTMYENMLIVENCYYFIKSGENEDKENESFLNLYSKFNNFIIMNNSEKINVFEDLDFIIEYSKQIIPLLNKNNPGNPSYPKDYLEALNNFSKDSKNYFDNNSFASVIEFKKEVFNLIFQHSKLRVIFTYDSKNKESVMSTLKKFVAYRKNVENYNIIHFDLENVKYLEEEEKLYLYFTQVAGVHFTNQNFENIFHYNLENLDITSMIEFADSNYAKFKLMTEAMNNNSLNQSLDRVTNKNEQINNNINGTQSKGKVNNYNSVNSSEKKFITAKIVEKLEDINYDERGNIKEASTNNYSSSNKNNIQMSVEKIQEKNKLADDFVKGENKNKEEEINKKIDSIMQSNNKPKVNEENRKTEDPLKHEYVAKKIKILFIYFVVYCLIYYFFYLRVSKRDESKYN